MRPSSSRAVVALVLVMTIATLTAPGTRAQVTYETVEVATGIYAFIPDELGIGNSVAIVRESDVVVVDAPTPAGARHIIAEIRRITDNPVRYLINTHWHDDHVWGNQEYLAAFPSVRIIAHANTRRDIEARAVPELASNIERLGAVVEQREAMIASGMDDDGNALTSDQIASLAQRNDMFRAVRADLMEVVPALPDVTVRGELTLRDSARPVVVFSPGRGHSEGDLAVHVPDAGVLVTGGLLGVPFPGGAEAFVGEWIIALDRLHGLGADHLVPAHGDVLTGSAHLELVRALLAEVDSQVRAVVARGGDLEAAQAAVDVDALREQLVGQEATAIRAFDAFFLRPAIESQFQVLTAGGS